MENIIPNISKEDIINKDWVCFKNHKHKNKYDNKFVIAKRPILDFCYNPFFIPKNVVEKYNNDFKTKLTMAVLKRKLSAMIYATMKTREKLYNEVYIHRFNTYKIVVDHKFKTIISVDLKEKTEYSPGSIIFYRNLCKRYELNTDRDDFVSMKKYHIYCKDNINPVNVQIRKNPNEVLWSDNDGKTWNSYVESITKEGYSIVKGKRKYWIYRLK